MFYVFDVVKVQWVAVVNTSGLCSQSQKSSERSHLCAGCDKKKTGCTRATAADTFHLQQVGNVVHGCVHVGRMNLMFIDAEVTVEWRILS